MINNALCKIDNINMALVDTKNYLGGYEELDSVNTTIKLKSNTHLLESLKKVEYVRYICNDIGSKLNGMRVLCIPNENATIFSAGIFTNAGSLLETENELGVAHFLEHMIFKGTKKYLKLTNILDEMGALYNAATTYESTDYEIHGLPFHSEKIIDILCDMYFNSIITQEEVENERHVIIEEYNMRSDTKGNKIYRSFMNLITKDKYQLYNRPIIGTKESIMKISKSDLINFKKKNYLPKNTMVILSGKFDVIHIMKIIQNVVNEQFVVDETALKKEITKEKSLIFHSLKNKIIKISDRVAYISTSDIQKQTILQINFPCYKKFHINNKYVSLLCSILSNGVSGRLSEEIRIKKGLTYSIGCESVSYNEFGIFSISLGVQNDKVLLALDAIFDILNILKKNGVNEIELNRAKNQQMTEIMITFQKQLSYFSYYMQNIYYGYEIGQLETIIEQINNVTISDINHIINKIFNYKQTYVIMYGSDKISMKSVKKSLLKFKQ